MIRQTMAINASVIDPKNNKKGRVWGVGRV